MTDLELMKAMLKESDIPYQLIRSAKVGASIDLWDTGIRFNTEGKLLSISSHTWTALKEKSND